MYIIFLLHLYVISQDDSESAANGTLDDDVDLSSPDSSPKRIPGTILACVPIFIYTLNVLTEMP